MKVSIITAIFNNKEFIEDCIKSVLGQNHPDIEYIIVDGGSTDGSLEVIHKYQDSISKFISEPDNGIYFALNKGIHLATGEVIGFLHADDIYANNNVIDIIVSRLINTDAQCCYSNLMYVDKKDISKVIRYWRSRPYEEGLFYKGWMPPHPTFFVKKEIYDKYGCFNTEFRIAADYELMLRFLEKNKITSCYVPDVLVKMRMGGTSNKNLINIARKTGEDYKAWKVNNLDGRYYTVFMKNISKVPQFFTR